MANEPTDQSDNSLTDSVVDTSTFPTGPGSLTDPVANTDEPEKEEPEQPDNSAQPEPDPELKDLAENGDDEEVADQVVSDIGTPEIADDNDLIEKEWVNKAKEIIEKTKEDPHQQSDVLTLFKADYIKKRYNKTIKTGE